MSAIPIGFILGGPIAGAILGVDCFGIPGWRWLFLLEGIPAIILGLATLFFLPDRPSQARWLRAEEEQLDHCSTRGRAGGQSTHAAYDTPTSGRGRDAHGWPLFLPIPAAMPSGFGNRRCSSALPAWSILLSELDGLNRLWCGSDWDAHTRLELGSHARAPLALRPSTISGFPGVGCVVPLSSIKCTPYRGAHAGRIQEPLHIYRLFGRCPLHF